MGILHYTNGKLSKKECNKCIKLLDIKLFDKDRPVCKKCKHKRKMFILNTFPEKRARLYYLGKLSSRDNRENLTDGYMKALLTSDKLLNRDDITQELISLKRKSVETKRLLNAYKN